MRTSLLSIGDELVLGQTVDTNSAYLSQRLTSIGIQPTLHLTVSDDQQSIQSALQALLPQSDLIIITGGLGPTADDLTRQAIAAAMQVPLIENPIWIAQLESFFSKLKRPMPPINRIQAQIPQGAQMLPNPAGTAAGIYARLNHCHLFALPGVPSEMKIMYEQSLAPTLQSLAPNLPVILTRTLHTFGQGESAIAQKLGHLMDRNRNPLVGTTVSDGIVSLRLRANFPTPAQAARELDQTQTQIHQILSNLIYGQDLQTLPNTVATLLNTSNATLATAESCTAGLLAKLLTDEPGASQYFHQGWITYTNHSKSTLLNVPPQLIDQHGAVSEPVAQSMAQNARQIANTTHALSITGIAGPDGATPDKPVGTVCIALATSNATQSKSFLFTGNRDFIRLRSALMALTILRYNLLNQPLPF